MYLSSTQYQNWTFRDEHEVAKLRFQANHDFIAKFGSNMSVSPMLFVCYMERFLCLWMWYFWRKICCIFFLLLFFILNIDIEIDIIMNKKRKKWNDEEFIKFNCKIGKSLQYGCTHQRLGAGLLKLCKACIKKYL